jgi:hypothetical protein
MFHELSLPILEKNYKKFYVPGKTSTVLLKTNGDIIPLTHSSIADVLFDTELDAHDAACDYYTAAGKDYPYLSEWGKALFTMMQGATHNAKTNIKTDIEQETMEF